MNKIALLSLGIFLFACAEQEQGDPAVADNPAADGESRTHLGGCILMAPIGDVPDDLYAHGDVVPAQSIAPFTKELTVYGLRLAARDDASDDFMRLVARTITESFPQRDDLDLALQREVLANHYRYNSLIPVPVGDDFSFMEDNPEQWAELESNNSLCDIIMQDVPGGQVMEVVEHILHYVTDMGLHYTFPNEWGINNESTLAEAMRISVDNGYYDVSGYNDIDDKEVRFRVEMQEFAYWFISTAWNLQEAYGPVGEEEWVIRNQEDLRQKLPAMYDAYERTAARVMVAPSLSTLKEIGPTRAEEAAR
jgi:hypothetical protein